MKTAFRWAGIVVLVAVLSGVGAVMVDIVAHRLSTPDRIAAILDAAEPSERSLSRSRIERLLAVEDPTFFDRQGVDFATPGQGWTTIGQGLGKRIYFTDFAPGIRKARLIYLTRLALFPSASHDDILHAFVAAAYLGHSEKGPVIGFAAGAQAWFGKPLDALSEDQYLALVAMLIGPNALRPTDDASANRARVARIKGLLAGRCRPNGWGDVWLEGCA